MAESLWLAVCPRRDSSAPLIVSRRVDDAELQAFAAELGAVDPDVVEVWMFPLAAEKSATFSGSIFLALVKEHQEREMYARLKAKLEPAAVVGVPGPVHFASAEVKPVVLVDPAVPPSITYPEIPKPDAPGVKFYEPPEADSGYVVPSGRTPEEVAGKVNADLGAPFTAVVVDGVVRLHQVVRGVSSLVVTPEEPATPEEPSPDGVAFLASMARQLRPSLPEASCLAAARELYHKLGGYSTARAAEAIADRAALLDAGIPSASIVGKP